MLYDPKKDKSIKYLAFCGRKSAVYAACFKKCCKFTCCPDIQGVSKRALQL